MDTQDFSLDSEWGGRPIFRCLFAAWVSIREVHHLTHPILASEKGPNTICRCCLWENDPNIGKFVSVKLVVKFEGERKFVNVQELKNCRVKLA